MINRVVSILILVSTIAQQAVYAQDDKRVNNTIQIGSGLFFESGPFARENFPGLAISVSYGIDIPLNDVWSIMPGAGITSQFGDILDSKIKIEDGRLCIVTGKEGIGEWYTSTGTVDLFCFARRRLSINKTVLILGLGPKASYDTNGDASFPDKPVDYSMAKRKLKRLNVQLVPNATILLPKHWTLGLEGSLGLLDMKNPDKIPEGSIHLFNILLTTGWYF